MKKICALVFISACICGTSAYTLSNNDKFSNIDNNTVMCNTNTNSQGTGIFAKENLKYLSEKEQEQLKEIQALKDKGIKLSDEQISQLQCIVTTVVRGKLGDEKYKDFSSLMEKKKNDEKLSEEESHRLKEYKKTLHNCEDCSNSEVFKQFFR